MVPGRFGRVGCYLTGSGRKMPSCVYGPLNAVIGALPCGGPDLQTAVSDLQAAFAGLNGYPS